MMQSDSSHEVNMQYNLSILRFWNDLHKLRQSLPVLYILVNYQDSVVLILCFVESCTVINLCKPLQVIARI